MNGFMIIMNGQSLKGFQLGGPTEHRYFHMNYQGMVYPLVVGKSHMAGRKKHRHGPHYRLQISIAKH
jgi:hypothetical protein